MAKQTEKGRPLRYFAQQFSVFKREAARVVAQEGVKFFKASFRRKGWLDEQLKPWPPRKAEPKNRRGAQLLVQTGLLRRSIRVVELGPNYVVWGTDVPYAKAHNEGEDKTVTVTVRAHERRQRGKRTQVPQHSRRQRIRIPQRQFMGDSRTLRRELQLTLQTMLNQRFKGS